MTLRVRRVPQVRGAPDAVAVVLEQENPLAVPFAVDQRQDLEVRDARAAGIGDPLLDGSRTPSAVRPEVATCHFGVGKSDSWVAWKR